MAPSSNWRRAQHWAVEKTVVTSATIKLFLPLGDAKSLRTAEISNWTGKAVAAPRTELDELLAREELEKAGIYILSGNDPVTNAPLAYIGEAEIIRDRLKQHKTKEFWVSAIVFVSKDAEFSSPSAAAAAIHGGHANGLTAWKTADGKSLKQLDEQEL